MKILFNKASLKATYFEDKKRIFFETDGYLDLEQAKKMYSVVLDFMKTNKVQSFLHDLTELKGTFTNFTTWLLENMKGMIELGLKYDALVLSSDIFTQFAADDLSKKVTVLEVQLFKSMDEATDWLEQREEK